MPVHPGLGQYRMQDIAPLLPILVLIALSGCSQARPKDAAYYEEHPLERDTKLDSCMPEPKRKGGECRTAKLAADRAYAAIRSAPAAR